MIRTAAFVALLLFCLTPWCSPPIALALGLAFALTVGSPFKTSKVTRVLLQASVVGLGFGMNLQRVIEAGRTGILFTLATIAGTLLLGYLLGRAMRISRGNGASDFLGNGDLRRKRDRRGRSRHRRER